MTAYLVVNYDIVDLDQYRAYQKQAAPILNGGKLIVLDPASEAKEGEPGAQTVIIEYPDKATALAAYHSDEYQAVIGIRHGASANLHAVIVDGLA